MSQERDDQTGSDELRRTIRAVAGALRTLHRELVEVARAEYEASHGDVGSPGQMLQLLLNDQAFAWMRVLSELMVDIDELIDVRGITDVDATAVRAEVEKLVLSPEGDTSDFAVRYKAALQREPQLVMTHAEVRRVLAALPRAAEADRDAVSAARPNWSSRSLESRRERRRG
jgi:hypothetical protein